MCTVRADFDVTTGRLQNQPLSRELIATPQILHNLWYCNTYSKLHENNVDFATGTCPVVTLNIVVRMRMKIGY